MAMQSSQNTVNGSQQLMLEVGDRLLNHLQSIALEVNVAQQRLTGASPVESIREPINRAIIELDRAEHDLREVLAAVALNNAAAPGSHGAGSRPPSTEQQPFLAAGRDSSPPLPSRHGNQG